MRFRLRQRLRSSPPLTRPSCGATMNSFALSPSSSSGQACRRAATYAGAVTAPLQGTTERRWPSDGCSEAKSTTPAAWSGCSTLPVGKRALISMMGRPEHPLRPERGHSMLCPYRCGSLLCRAGVMPRVLPRRNWLCHCEERKRRSNLASSMIRGDCFGPLGLAKTD